MTFSDTRNANTCPSGEIAGYIDGELSPDAELSLERHFAECAACREELNLQKSILLALDSSLDEEIGHELPEDFTRAVVANAESRVSGLRRPTEIVTAVVICAALLVFSVVALGGDAGATLSAFGGAGERLLAIAAMVGRLFFDVAIGIVVVFRTLFSSFLFGSWPALAAFGGLFLASVYLISRIYLRQRSTSDS